MTAITENNMAPFYEETCNELGWQMDNKLLTNMKAANATQIEKLDSAIEDAEKNLSETEVREAHLVKAEYLSRIGDKEAALTQFRKTYDKTVSLGHRLDLLFHMIRIGIFYLDHDLITRNISKAKSLIEEGGDWDRRNRLKVYQGMYCLAVRDFKGSASYFLDTVSTFTCYELMDYQTFVTYTVLASIISLPRVELREKFLERKRNSGCAVSKKLLSEEAAKIENNLLLSDIGAIVPEDPNELRIEGLDLIFGSDFEESFCVFDSNRGECQYFRFPG
ncbi:26S proteasome non-ATPase regulatory subunit 6 [Ixodes scapularis]